MGRSLTESFAATGFAVAIKILRRELVAGVTLGIVTLPIAIPAGILVYAQLGRPFFAEGVLSAIYSVIFAGITAAIIARSSFMMMAPAASVVIIPAALVGYLAEEQAFAAHPQLIVVAVTLCTFLAGVLQALFGALNVGRFIKFTPHPVIAGFVNSVALLIILSQLRPFVKFGAAAGNHFVSIERPVTLLFIFVLAAFTVAVSNLPKKVPAPLAGLLVGTAAYYFLRAMVPSLNLGSTIGVLPAAFPSLSPLLELHDGETRAAILSLAPHLLLISFTLAMVATLQALLAFRVAQNLSEVPPWPRRDVIALGAANCASALAGGLMAYPPPLLLTLSFRAGGRTRIVPITAGLSILLAAFFLSPALAALPVAVLSAILIGIAFQLFDRWSFRLLDGVARGRPGLEWRVSWHSLSVVAIVMLVSVLNSIVVGAIAGFVLSCLIFIIDMSRPIVRRSVRGDAVFSKRSRCIEDMALLRRTGASRVALELQGVLFFGNADDLSHVVDGLLPDCDMILFDLRGISDIDVSGATILGNVVARCHSRSKHALFCNVPKTLATAAFTERASAILPDFDTALEWMEEEALRTAAGARPRSEPIAVEALDLVKILDREERAVLMSLLQPRSFASGAVLCNEGDEADRMWIIAKGSMSMRLRGATPDDFVRIASMGAGTTVGEMSLLDGGARSATVVCDEDVVSYELSRAAFDTILRDHAPLARKLFTYFAREMVQRLRLLNRDLLALNR